jgi:hypothetical protein
MARALDMKPKSVKRKIERLNMAPGVPAKLGRPESIDADARWKIRSCYQQHFGQWGSEVLSWWVKREGIGCWVPDTIAKVIADLKPKPEKKRKPLRYEITEPMVMWSEDGAGFKDGKRKREAMILQDECARYKVHTRLAEGPASEQHVLEYLEEAFQTHGAPLILKQDNIAYQNTEAVQKLCNRHGVLLLNSPVHYPQYNGKKERSVRDIKGYIRALQRNDVGENLEEQLALAVHDLNVDRPRPVLGGHTAQEVFAHRQHRLPNRKQFLIRVQTKQLELEEKAVDRKEKEAARRRAVEQVLLHYDLIKWKGNVSANLKAKTATT